MPRGGSKARGVFGITCLPAMNLQWLFQGPKQIKTTKPLDLQARVFPDFRVAKYNLLVRKRGMLFVFSMLEGEVVLYVEDDDAYAEIMECVLNQSGINHRLITLNSGALAQEYLSGIGEFSDRARYPLPRLILADLKMPGMTGLELLQWVRSHPTSRSTPFVILTSSDDLKDVTRAYQLGANSFLVKPPTVPDLIEMVKGVRNFWSKESSGNRGKLPPASPT